MSWFTWFFGANVILMGWMVLGNKPMEPTVVWALCLAWLFYNLSGAVAGMFVVWYILRVGRLVRQQGDLFGFPVWPAAYGAAANVAALVVNSILWGILATLESHKG